VFDGLHLERYIQSLISGPIQILRAGDLVSCKILILGNVVLNSVYISQVLLNSSSP